MDTNFMHKLGRHFGLASNGGRMTLPYNVYGAGALGSGSALLGYPIHPSLLQSQAALLRNQALNVETLFRGGHHRPESAVSPGACSDKPGIYRMRVSCVSVGDVMVVRKELLHVLLLLGQKRCKRCAEGYELCEGLEVEGCESYEV